MTQAFTKKQLTIIFKIAFLEAMALSIIMPSVTSSGEIPGLTKFGCIFDPVTHLGCQTGTFFVTIPTGATFGTQNITFPTPFAVAPNVTVSFSEGINVENTETKLSFLAENVGSTVTLGAGTTIIFPTHTIQQTIDVSPPPIISASLQMDITTKTGVGTSTFWIQGLDCTLNAWETFGNSANTPGITTTTTGFKIGSIVAVNQTLINDDNGICPTPFMQLRVVATTTSAPTWTISGMTMSYFLNLPTGSPSTLGASTTTTGTTILVSGVPNPASYNGRWLAYTTL
jgi:hypothetical protein